jgi:hypothetical protein
MTFDEARLLPNEKRVSGLKVSGSQPAFGGSWIYDPEADELTLQEPPTALSAPKQEETDHAG